MIDPEQKTGPEFDPALAGFFNESVTLVPLETRNPVIWRTQWLFGTIGSRWKRVQPC